MVITIQSSPCALVSRVHHADLMLKVVLCCIISSCSKQQDPYPRPSSYMRLSWSVRCHWHHRNIESCLGCQSLRLKLLVPTEPPTPQTQDPTEILNARKKSSKPSSSSPVVTVSTNSRRRHHQRQSSHWPSSSFFSFHPPLPPSDSSDLIPSHIRFYPTVPYHLDSP